MSKIWVILSVSVVILLILYFFVCKFFYRCRLLNDILKEAGPDKVFRYSQGRVYLLLSILAYFITLGVLTSKGLKPNISIDTNTINLVIDSLKWAIMLFAGYVFGGKGLEVLKFIMNKNGAPAPENKAQVEKVIEKLPKID